MTESFDHNTGVPVKQVEPIIDALDQQSFAGQRELMIRAHDIGTKDKPVTPEFVAYFDPSMSLEDRVLADMDELQIGPDKRQAVQIYLDLIKVKHQGSYEHSLRVGLIARQIAKFMGIDEKALLYAGLLHDIGKAAVPISTLAKTEGWTDQDTALVQGHVKKSYELLRDEFDFTAEVVLRHHLSQAKPYPTELPDYLHKYGEDTVGLIKEYGRVLALADVYDALHRINDKHGVKRALSGQEIYEQMLVLNPDRTELVEQLYGAGVFTRDIK
ncbi:MAG: HD domain-containing protein [Patescibacteria group bacterium]